MSIKVTVVETYRVYQWKHYDIDEERIIKEFGSIENFEKQKDLDFLFNQNEIDIKEMIDDNSEFIVHIGHKDVSSKGKVFDIEEKSDSELSEGSCWMIISEKRRAFEADYGVLFL